MTKPRICLDLGNFLVKTAGRACKINFAHVELPVKSFQVFF